MLAVAFLYLFDPVLRFLEFDQVEGKDVIQNLWRCSEYLFGLTPGRPVN